MVPITATAVSVEWRDGQIIDTTWRKIGDRCTLHLSDGRTVEGGPIYIAPLEPLPSPGEIECCDKCAAARQWGREMPLLDWQTYHRDGHTSDPLNLKEGFE